MKTRRYSEAQIFRILKEVESGVPVVNAAREHGVPWLPSIAGKASMEG